MGLKLDRFKATNKKVQASKSTTTTDPSRQAGFDNGSGGSGDEGGAAVALLKTQYASPELKRWQDACDDLHIAKSLAMAGHASKNRQVDPREVDEQLLSTPLGLAQAMAAVDLSKAMDTQTANEGLEFIPDEFSSTFIERYRLEMKVAAQHEHFTMPRSPWTLPIAGADQTARRIPESLTDAILTTGLTPAITPVTGNQGFTAETLGAMVVISRELEMDSIIPVVQFARSRLTTAVISAVETATINGVRWNAVHFDADIEADPNKETRAEVAWDGYRQVATAREAVVGDGTVRVNFGGNPLSTKALRQMRNSMGIYGVDPSQLMYVVSVAGHSQMLDLDELITVDKFGPNATIVKGQVGMFDGSPVIVSEFQRQDLEATGRAANPATGDTTLVHVVHRPSFQYGERQALRWQLIDWPVTRQKVAMLDMRADFRSVVDDPTAVTFVVEGYNIPV